MSCNELAMQLERSFRSTTTMLRRLLDGLKQRRVAWASARPSTLQPSPELEQVAKALADEERARGGLLGQIATLLTLPPGVTAEDLHVNVTRIAAAVPAPLGRALRLAADEATSVAKTVRVEITLGERLLRFTRRAQDGVLGQLAAQAAQHEAVTGYDRHARIRAGLGAGGASGQLIDGRV